MGRRYVWNSRTGTEVPYSNVLDVDGNPNLEWMEEQDEPVPEPGPSAAEPEQPPVKPRNTRRGGKK